jgi:putative transcriptional regulator
MRVVGLGPEKDFKIGQRPMTEAQVKAAADADPNARPMTSDALRKAKRIPRVKIIRRALGFTQEEFAAR